MTAATEMGSELAYLVEPTNQYQTWVVQYTKANAADYINLQTYCPTISSILMVLAMDDGTGTIDPVSWSGTTVTFSTATTVGRLLVIGK